MQTIHKCDFCEGVTHKKKLTTVGDKRHCPNCPAVVCFFSGEIIPKSEAVEVDGRWMKPEFYHPLPKEEEVA